MGEYVVVKYFYGSFIWNMANATIDDLKRYAATHLDKKAFDYYSTGTDDDVTLRENRQAFNR